jgi:hypothetical protein
MFKRVAIAVVILGLVCSAAEAEIIDPNLHVWYKLDETEGDIIHDSSGRGFDSYESGASEK